MAKAVVIYSGGMDSFTVLHRAIANGHDVIALSVDYGQRHFKELNYAQDVCQELGIPHKRIQLHALRQLASNSSLTSEQAVPLGHYAEPSMKQTVVPNRNMVLLSLAIACAVNEEADYLYCGVHAGDHAIYPDCRPEFMAAMNEAAEIANYRPVQIIAPFQYDSKGEILRWGLTYGLDYAKTWTCYNGRDKACGKCGSCTERLEAFAQNAVTDPLEYE